MEQEISPDEEHRLVRRLMRENGVKNPDILGELAPVLAIGLTNSAWRNTVVEDWHSGDSPLSDGDMMRINSHTTFRIRGRITRWMRDYGLGACTVTSQLADLHPKATENLIIGLYWWLVRPGRRLPTGQTLAQLAEATGGDVEDYADSADSALSGVLAMIEERGPEFALQRCAVHGTLACKRWWGHPSWPAQTKGFVAGLRAGSLPYLDKLRECPPEIADLDRLERLLRSRPWEIDSESCEWLVDAGIGYYDPATTSGN